MESWTLCAHCGACNARGPIIPHNWRELPPPEWLSPHRRCPSFEYYNFRAYNAQGRGIMAMLFFDDKNFPITDDLVKVVYTCTSCGVCSDICKAVDPLSAIWALREEMVERGASLPAPLQRIHGNIGKYGNMFGATRPAEIEGVASKGENIFFAGCDVRFGQLQVIEATAKILKSAGIDMGYLGKEERCCGFIPGHDGNTTIMEKQAVDNIDTLKAAGAKRVIVSCAHCYKALKIDYPLIAGTLPFQVVHVSELFAQIMADKRLSFPKAQIKRQVTYHDPCFLGRHSGIYDPPRTVLNGIPGIELKEMERNRRWSYCCGSGAKISSACYPDFGTAVSKQRLIEGRKAASTIVTSCTTCLAHMKKTTRKDPCDVEITDLSLLLADTLGIDIRTGGRH